MTAQGPKKRQNLPGGCQCFDGCAVYIHIPYCLEKCPYCDFHSVAVARPEIPERAYAKSLMDQLREERRRWAAPPRLASVYFGGGTPSLMPAEFFAEVLGEIGRHFSVPKEIEITVETNPKTADRKAFQQWLTLGINRISFGTQSFSDFLLKKLGRSHTADEGREAVLQAKEAGFQNINADLIFGIEDQTRTLLEKDLYSLLTLNVPHVSAYQLTVEPGTPLAHRVQTGAVVLPDEECLTAMHRRVAEALETGGLQRYEISNYARPGRECRHNLQYWQNGDYLGLGSGAVSKIGNRRWRTTRHLKKYLSGDFQPDEEETLDDKTIRKERWMMGLRLREGLSLRPEEKDWALLFEEWEQNGWAQLENGRIALTEQGFLLASALTKNVFEFIERVC